MGRIIRFLPTSGSFTFLHRLARNFYVSQSVSIPKLHRTALITELTERCTTCSNFGFVAYARGPNRKSVR